MTLFEFLSVAVSIVLALGLTRLVHGLRLTVDPKTRYWVHCGYVASGIVARVYSNNVANVLPSQMRRNLARARGGVARISGSSGAPSKRRP